MNSSRNIGLDLLRIICIFTVVIIHTPHLSDACWRGLLRYLPFANACFAFMSGMFLFRNTKEVEFAGLIRKRVYRLLIPYASWTFIYVLWGFASRMVYGRELFPSLEQWVDIVFFGGAQGQLWFVIFLFYAQTALMFLVFPVRGWRRWILLLGAVLVVIFLRHYIVYHVFRKFSLLFLYCALGVLWSSICQNVLHSSPKWLLFSIATSFGVFSWFFKSQILGVAAWIMLFQFIDLHKFRRFSNGIIKVSACTMGIYLIHHMVPAYLINKVLPCAGDVITNGHILLLLTSLVIFLISLFAVFFGRNIRWFRFICGE